MQSFLVLFFPRGRTIQPATYRRRRNSSGLASSYLVPSPNPCLRLPSSLSALTHQNLHLRIPISPAFELWRFFVCGKSPNYACSDMATAIYLSGRVWFFFLSTFLFSFLRQFVAMMMLPALFVGMGGREGGRREPWACLLPWFGGFCM